LQAPTWKLFHTVDAVVEVVNANVDFGGALISNAHDRIVSIILVVALVMLTSCLMQLSAGWFERLAMMLAMAGVAALLRFSIASSPYLSTVPATCWYWICCATFWITVAASKLVNRRSLSPKSQQAATDNHEIQQHYSSESYFVPYQPSRIASRRNLTMKYEDLCGFSSLTRFGTLTNKRC
jgi:small-conductance mechanosensitive channel